MTEHELVLLRHGQSEWNLTNVFTGWTDVPLTEQGKVEAREAGRLMADASLEFDIVYTSLLSRAIETANIALDTMDLGWLPVKRHWRLNERHYGDLQGRNKKETADLHGLDQVAKWRRSYDIPPPPLERSDPRHPAQDRRYADLAPELVPATECLADVVARMLPYWYDQIVPDIFEGRTVLVVAHGNSLRALVKHLEGVSDEDIADLNIPTGIPLHYRLDESLKVLSVAYLGDASAAKAAAEAVAKQAGA